MGKRNLACWVALATACGASALAGEVTGLTTFTAGTPAVAAQVNGNFDAVAAAVNDNHARLATAEDEIAALDADADGAASVKGYALVSTSFSGPHICGVRSVGPWSYFSSDPIEVSNFGCTAAAPISLPHGARLTGLTCRMNDLYANGSISLSLTSAGVTNDSGSLIFSLPATTDVGEQTLADTTAAGGTDVVNNIDYAYHLMVSFDLDSPDEFFDIEQALAIAGCSVTYSRN